MRSRGAAYLMAYAISQSTLNRVSLFAKTMEAVEQGDVRPRLKPEGDDEIAQLMRGFDRMMDRMDGLMEERVEYARQIKHLELKALQPPPEAGRRPARSVHASAARPPSEAHST